MNCQCFGHSSLFCHISPIYCGCPYFNEAFEHPRETTPVCSNCSHPTNFKGFLANQQPLRGSSAPPTKCPLTNKQLQSCLLPLQQPLVRFLNIQQLYLPLAMLLPYIHTIQQPPTRVVATTPPLFQRMSCSTSGFYPYAFFLKTD